MASIKLTCYVLCVFLGALIAYYSLWVALSGETCLNNFLQPKCFYDAELERKNHSSLKMQNTSNQALTLTMVSPTFPAIPSEVFGTRDVIIASSRDLLSWLYLDSRLCDGDETKTLKFRYMDVKLTCKTDSDACNIWYWDVANWTINYTTTNMFNGPTRPRFCPTPIQGERTAKIIQANGKVEYPGCTNAKHPCTPFGIYAATFDENVKQRINQSPCCRKQTIDVTQHMARVFDKHNITYFLVGGAVIGLVRDGGVHVPYDTDIDVGVDSNDYDKILMAFPELIKPGYTFEWVKKHDKDGRHWYMVGCANPQCLTGPGIALYYVKDDVVTAPAPLWTYPVNISVPPIKRMFEGMQMSFPKEPEKYLDFVYGKDKWTTPLKCTKHNYSQCSE